jgi:hypothetical protein
MDNNKNNLGLIPYPKPVDLVPITRSRTMSTSNKQTLDKSNDKLNVNNSLMTKTWGPSLWVGLHAITFGYPISPTKDEINNYKIFFEHLGHVLPCSYCKDSYLKFIKEGETALTDKVLESRASLTKWLYNIHNSVNKKLGMNYHVNFEDVVEKYEACRAQCVKSANTCSMPLNLKTRAYNALSNKHAPIISYDIAIKFIPYAEKRLPASYITILRSCKNIDKKTTFWKKRDEICIDIINKMRIQGISQLEQDGIYKGLPSIDELKLICLLSTNVSDKELETASNLATSIV